MNNRVELNFSIPSFVNIKFNNFDIAVTIAFHVTEAVSRKIATYCKNDHVSIGKDCKNRHIAIFTRYYSNKMTYGNLMNAIQQQSYIDKNELMAIIRYAKIRVIQDEIDILDGYNEDLYL